MPAMWLFAMPTTPTMWFAREPDGVTLQFYVSHPTWSLDLLESDQDWLTWADGVVTVTCLNGTWSWRETHRKDLGYGRLVVHTEPAPAAAGEPS